MNVIRHLHADAHLRLERSGWCPSATPMARSGWLAVPSPLARSGWFAPATRAASDLPGLELTVVVGGTQSRIAA